MTSRYFFHSSRGFSNEADIYVLPADDADDWAAWFIEAHRPASDYAATALEPITRKQAERLLRRDGVGLMTDSDDYSFLAGENMLDRLTPDSIKSAHHAATRMRADWEKNRAFELAMAEQYPEYAQP